MQLDLPTVGSLISLYFNPAEVKRIARQTGFVQRVSGLSGAIFLQAMVFGCLEKAKATVNHWAQVCLDLQVVITPQGLDTRFSAQSVAFMQAMFALAMRTFVNHLPLPLLVLQQFTAINLIDSSIIPLPERMADEYPGSGGNASPASLKVRLVFDFLCGNLQQVLLAPGREPDQGFTAYLLVVAAGSLNLMDLGHFNLDGFKRLAARLAYFLSRYKAGIGILMPDGRPVDLLPWLQAVCHARLDHPIRLGKAEKYQIPCRLIAFRLSQQVAEQRRRRVKANAKRRGEKIRAATLALLDYQIFVTNVPATLLSADQVARLYRVRWQIELVFKLWKSYAGLRQFTTMRRERVLTELYARLIGLVLTQFLVAPLRMPERALSNREISPVQVRHIFERFARPLSQRLGNPDQLVAELASMLAHIRRFGFKQKRKKRPNVCHALALISAVCHLDYDSETVLDFTPLLA